MGLATFFNPVDFPPVYLRGLQFLAFSESAVVQTRTVTSDGGGGGTSTWANAGTFVCRVDSMGGATRLVASRLDERSTDVITFPTNGTVSLDDRIVIANRGTFEVTALTERTGQMMRQVEVAAV